MIRRFRKQRPVTEINITPFTDVILVLLIIFMVATPLILQESIKVNLPTAKAADPLDRSTQRYITITSEGVIYLGKELVTQKELAKRVKQEYEANPNLVIILNADKLVRFKDVVAVIDILKHIGVQNLNIAAKES